jgi:hypothetical protein
MLSESLGCEMAKKATEVQLRKQKVTVFYADDQGCGF